MNSQWLYRWMEAFVVRRFMIPLCITVALALLLFSAAAAEGNIATTVLMRVSHMTRNAIVDVGEDLTIEISVDGVDPAAYQWYFNDTALEGADQKVYNLENAQVEDSGVYRMDAFDESGKLLVSVDVYARVIDNTVPKAGDASMPVGFAWGAMLACSALLIALLRRRGAAE